MKFTFAVALVTSFVAAEDMHAAVLVAGSNGFWNYRHQADIHHAYSIMIKNIPKNLKVNYIEELKKIIKLHKAEISIVVEKIVLVYEMKKLEEIEEEIDEKVL